MKEFRGRGVALNNYSPAMHSNAKWMTADLPVQAG